MTDPFTAAVEAFHNAPGNTTDGVRAACAAYVAALPRMQPSDAEVQEVARALWQQIRTQQTRPGDWPTWGELLAQGHQGANRVGDFRLLARAALATLPALPTPDAAALRVQGFAECQRAALEACHTIRAREALDAARSTISPAERRAHSDRQYGAGACHIAIAGLKPEGGK